MLIDYLVTECTIKRPSTSNDKGIAVVNYTSLGSVKCSLRQLTGSEILSNDRKNYKTTHRFYLLPPSSFEIKNGDIITANSVNYEVKVPNNPMNLDKLMQVDCEFRSEIQ